MGPMVGSLILQTIYKHTNMALSYAARYSTNFPAKANSPSYICILLEATAVNTTVS